MKTFKAKIYDKEAIVEVRPNKSGGYNGFVKCPSCTNAYSATNKTSEQWAKMDSLTSLRSHYNSKHR